MRDSVSKLKIAAQIAGDNSTANNSATVSGKAEKEKKGVQIIINDDICGALLDVSFQRMLKKNAQPGGIGTLELWSDEFDGKGDFSQYRSKLVWWEYHFMLLKLHR